jgi:hypothetical protein
MQAALPALLLMSVHGLVAAHGESSAAEAAKKGPVEVDGFGHGYAARVDFGARLEPERGIIHGAGQDPAGYEEYSALFDKAHRPMMQMTYITLTGGVQPVLDWQAQVQASLDRLRDQPTTLQIGLNLTAGRDDGSGRVDQVAEGRYDEALAAFISALEAFGVPAWVRIGYEFEGSWNGYGPGGYVAAYRYITDRLREAPLDNVATVWCAAGGSAGWLEFDRLMAYYPGDGYVDWWGVDTFSEDELGHPWLADFYARAAQHRKPVMIGEATPRYVGADKGAESWNRWFRPFFEMVRKHPEIKAISYINWDWAYWSDALGFSWHDWEDARLQNDDLVRRLYVDELSDPVWIHAPEAQRVEPKHAAEQSQQHSSEYPASSLIAV